MFDNIKADMSSNGIGFLGTARSLLTQDAFGAVIMVRLYLLLEKRGLPTFLPYRVLRHIHGLEFARNCRIGPGLCLPHPLGVLFTAGTIIGCNARIYGMVRFIRQANHTPRIGDNVFIGDSAIFRGGVSIGDNCIVGAGSVVTKSFESNLVVAGNPARVLRSC